MRNQTIDTIKGILIILVIIIHIISSGPMTQYFSYIIDSFFMQLFFAISGYLLTQRSMQKSLKELFVKYGYRMGVPFLFAYFIYSLLEKRLLDIFYPYTWFHLWFIVAFMIMVIFLNILEKFKINKVLVLLVALIFTFLWVGMFGKDGTVEIYLWMGHKAVYFNFVFFYIGYYIRNHRILSSKYNPLIWFIFIFSATYIWLLNNIIQINFLYSLIWILLNLSIIYLVLFGALKYPAIKVSLVTWIGRISLPIYLLHIIPLLLLKPFLREGILSPYLYVILYFIGVIIVMLTIYASKDTKFGKIFILGEPIGIQGIKK